MGSYFENFVDIISLSFGLRCFNKSTWSHITAPLKVLRLALDDFNLPFYLWLPAVLLWNPRSLSGHLVLFSGNSSSFWGWISLSAVEDDQPLSLWKSVPLPSSSALLFGSQWDALALTASVCAVRARARACPSSLRLLPSENSPPALEVSLQTCVRSEADPFTERSGCRASAVLCLPSRFLSFHVLCWRYESFNFLGIWAIVLAKPVSDNAPSRLLGVSVSVLFYSSCRLSYRLPLSGFGYFCVCSRYCREKSQEWGEI